MFYFTLLTTKEKGTSQNSNSKIKGFRKTHFDSVQSKSYLVKLVKLHNLPAKGMKMSKLRSTYGSFILMNTRHVKKDTKTHTKPRKSRRNRFSLDMPTALDLSKIMKPNPPMEKRKLDAKPSMMYWPFTRYGMKATCSRKTHDRVVTIAEMGLRSTILA